MAWLRWPVKAQGFACLGSCPGFPGDSVLTSLVSLPCLGFSVTQSFPVYGKFVSGFLFL